MQQVLERSVPLPKYRLRWRFDYLNKPTKIGVFNGNGGDNDAAWLLDKTGLVRASIEGENLETNELKTLAEIDGHDYATMEWIAYSRMPGFYKYMGDVTPRVYIGGISLFSRQHKLNVFVDGTYIVEELTAEEKLFHKKEHSI